AERGRRSWGRKSAWYDDGRKAGHCSKNAVALHLGLPDGHHKPLLMREHDRIESLVSHDLHDMLLQLGTLLKTQAIAVVHLETLCFRDAVLDIRMKLAGRDDLLERFNGRVARGKISVNCRLQFVQMNADIRGKLSAIEIWGVQLDYRCARPVQILDRSVRDAIDLVVDGCSAEETAQYADALALETIGLQEFRVVL